MKYICLILLLFFCYNSAFAQADTSRHHQDSLLNLKLDQQQNKVRELSAQRLIDSLKKITLQQEILQLSANDKEKRASLLLKINTLQQADSLRQAQQKRQVDSLKKIIKGFPVVPFRDTLFYIFTRQGSFTAKDRAEAIRSRIDDLDNGYNFNKDSLKIAPSELTTDIVFNGQLLLSVSDQDALWQDTNRDKLAKLLRDKISDAIVKHQAETKWQTLLRETVFAIVVIIVVILLIYALNRTANWVIGKFRASKRWFTNGIRIKDYELLNAERQLYVVGSIVKLVKWFVIILIIYLAFPVLFGIFPFTRNISVLLLGYVTAPLNKIGSAVWDYIPNFITILVIVFIFRYILKFFRFIKLEIERGQLNIPGFYADWANPTYQIVRVLVLAFLLIVIFPYLPGSDSAVFKGVSVFMGVLFTFGSAGALGNVVSGLVMTYMRAFKIGDRVKIGEVTGDIIEKTLLVTRLRTIQNEIISIPNSAVMSSHTLNYSSEAQEKGLIVHTTVTIGYDAPWRQVHQLLIDAALATEMIETEPAPYVLQTSLDDNYVSYRLNAFTRQPNKQAVIYSSLHANIQDEFNKAGVEIMSPHYRAVRDGNAPAMPSQYSDKDTPAK